MSKVASALRTLCAITLASAITPAFADPVQDARLEGALQTARSLNRMLNPFRIKVVVAGKQARELSDDEVIKVLAPLIIDDATLATGLDILETKIRQAMVP